MDVWVGDGECRSLQPVKKQLEQGAIERNLCIGQQRCVFAARQIDVAEFDRENQPSEALPIEQLP